VKFTLEYPAESPSATDGFLHPDAIRQICQHAEASWFSAVALSEHPAPSAKWRHGGGHDTLDPIAALGFMAGVTSTIRLLTNLYVLPFRNPYLAAKSLTSLDLVSGGRLIAGVGAGYLRSEFAALGVDFDRRAELLDEALAALWSIWMDPEIPVSGADFAAVGELWLQRPAQRPHPPLWIGGNGRAAMRRVVEYGTGWMPVISPPEFADSMRTVAIPDARRFGAAVNRLRDQLAAAGRAPEHVDIQILCPRVDLDDQSAVRRTRDMLDELAGYGATWAVVHIDGASVGTAVDYIKAFGETIIAQSRAAAEAL
jgi:probable F420-dependent oxidoreductase